MGPSFAADAEASFISPAQNVERIILLETNSVMNAGPILNRLKRFLIKP
jgi:hypothetical protein